MHDRVACGARQASDRPRDDGNPSSSDCALTAAIPPLRLPLDASELWLKKNFAAGGQPYAEPSERRLTGVSVEDPPGRRQSSNCLRHPVDRLSPTTICWRASASIACRVEIVATSGGPTHLGQVVEPVRRDGR